MGKKTLNINGKEFGEKLLSPNISIDPPRCDKKSKCQKFTKALKRLREEAIFKKKWEALWKWRNFKKTYELFQFFQMQCLIRHPDNPIQKGCLESYASNLFQLDEQTRRMFIYKADEDKLRAAFASDPIGVGKICASILDDMDNFIYQNTFGRCNMPLITYLKPDLEATDKLPDNIIYTLCVQEVFAEKDHKHDFHADCDFKQLKIDRANKMPTVYLRIDLRDFVMNNGIVLKDVTSVLKEAADRLNITVQKRPTSSAMTWEFLLMIHDLDEIGFTDEDITYLIQETVKKQVGSISDILKAARKFIASATTRDFPAQIWG